MDNADLRLTEKGYQVGVVSPERFAHFTQKRSMLAEVMTQFKQKQIYPTAEVNQYLEKKGIRQLQRTVTVAELLRRPEIDYEIIAALTDVPKLTAEIKEQVEIQFKYEGYIVKQEEQVKRFRRLEKKLLPADLDYGQIIGLSREGREKMSALKPRSIGQASRIPGVSPADINVLLVYLEKRRRQGGADNG
jgi:tRNA uridine 5-carboxymethylaminomethyl modification enzyme